jgi:hypothetical protein
VYSRFILLLLQVQFEKLDLVWRILLVGTDGSLYLTARYLFLFRYLNYHTLNSGIVINNF